MMKRNLPLLSESLASVFLFIGCWTAHAQIFVNPTLTVLSPLDYQVVQRNAESIGMVSLEVKTDLALSQDDAIEYRIHFSSEHVSPWEKLNGTSDEGMCRAKVPLPAGGWYRLEVRLTSDEAMVATAEVKHFGIGEVFVVAGQSNSANHGEERQQTQTARVVNFDGTAWQLANDPQPGASGQGGSFVPPLGDALVSQFNVPVGFVTCGIGATSVREWLPRGTRFPNPPTIESRVRQVKAAIDGEEMWESDGQAFEMFLKRLRPLGTNGFRAVLWHQGESDANQRDASRTLAGDLYYDYLSQIIYQSRKDLGWDAPWMVAQVSYHVPGDEASEEIRAAQALLWKQGVALEGPDSDSLKGDLREGNGQGVHFSGKGLREHANRWAAKISPWLRDALAQSK